MLWNKEDFQQYTEAKEYIDTILIPLISFSFGEDKEMIKRAGQGEVSKVFTKEIEKEFKGRLVLSPDYAYLASSSKAEEAVRLAEWVKHMKLQPFNHVFFFTFDSQWKKHEKELDGTVIWLPDGGFGDLGKAETREMIKEQIAGIKEFIHSYWS